MFTIVNINKKTAVNIYYLLWDIFCGFIAFVVFLCVFASVFYDKYIDFILNTYLSNSLGNYISSIRNFKEFQIGINIINLILKNSYNELKKKVQEQDALISENNKYYDNMFIYITVGIIGFFILLLTIPIFTKYIALHEINFMYILIKFLLYLIFIVSLELLVLLYLLPSLNPLHLYVFFETMFTK